jgi:phosphotransferase system enzyme I (PtsI)
MARSLEVPAVVGLHSASESLESGTTVLVDGYDGKLIVNPSEQTLFRYGKLRERRRHIRSLFERERGEKVETTDGVAVHLSANVDSADDAEAVQKSGAMGVGLFRTEMLYLRTDRFPDEDEQEAEYSQLARSLAPDPVIIRTLDIGGDKTSNQLFPQREDNPFMGFRAIRFCLEHPDIFKRQLRAILRASSQGNVRLMYPMISGVAELTRANRLLEEAKIELEERGQGFDRNLKIGCMIEIPSAAASLDLLAPHCDFFSIGTNDLIQYLMAVDRINDKVAYLYEPAQPAVLRTLRQIFRDAKAANRPVGVCGELAGDPLFIPLLLGLGASELSAVASVMPESAFLVRHFALSEARELAENALSLANPNEVRVLLQSFYEDHVGEAIRELTGEIAELS